MLLKEDRGQEALLKANADQEDLRSLFVSSDLLVLGRRLGHISGL